MSSNVVARGALFGMRFVDFFIFLFIFPEFVDGQQGCHQWGSIWDGICQIFFFLNLCMGCRMWGSIWVEFVQIYLFIFEFVCGLSPVCGLLLSQFFFSFNCSCLIKFGLYEIEAF
jgi:hypothetical protein